MGQKHYLIDSNCVIDYLGKKLPATGMSFLNPIIDDIPIVSVITKIEVLGFNALDEHLNILVNFMNDATILDLTDEIVNKSIELRKKYKTKLPDSIIAATAFVYNLVLISHNISDFKNIDELKVIDPHGL